MTTSDIRAVTCPECLRALAASGGPYARAAAAHLAKVEGRSAIDAADNALRNAMTKLAYAASGITKESAADEAVACWRAYGAARKAEGPERFTVDDRRVLRRILRPSCCHVTGEHNPRHYMEGWGPCEIQQAEAYSAAIEALDLPRFSGGDAISTPECPWCERPAAEIAAQRSAGGALVISKEAARAVKEIVDETLASHADSYADADIERILIVDWSTNSFAAIRAVTAGTRTRWATDPAGPIARICTAIENIEDVKPVAWNEKRLRFEVDAMPGAKLHERTEYGDGKPKRTMRRPARSNRPAAEIELRQGRLHLMWPDEGPSGT